MKRGAASDAIGALASLGDGVRRALYDYVAARGAPVGRDEAASALSITRPLAAYHLDRLVRAGLLDVHYERPAGRAGPGAGRPAKMYRRSPVPVEVSLPPRHYALAARLFADAIAEAGSGDARQALARSAAAAGRALADDLADDLAEADADGTGARLLDVLAAGGYEPYWDGNVLWLRNCPFHDLAAAHRDLVCGMNLALLQPLAEATSALRLVAVLDPRAGQCCVALVRRGDVPDAPNTDRAGEGEGPRLA